VANRANHYEAAFEGFVRSLRVPCVAIDEARRALGGPDGLKSPDFLLYPAAGPNLVVEVKGKKGKTAEGRRPWENWVTTDDLAALERWQALFGPGFRAVLAFAYAEPLQPFPLPGENGAYRYRGREYRFWAVGLDDYIAHLRSRGPAWKAVAMARAAFRRRVRPLLEWLPMTAAAPRRPRPVALPLKLKERTRVPLDTMAAALALLPHHAPGWGRRAPLAPQPDHPLAGGGPGSDGGLDRPALGGAE
jgi:hypothetical protein